MRHEDAYNFFSRITRRILYLFDASIVVCSFWRFKCLVKTIDPDIWEKHGNEGIHTVGHEPKIKPHLCVQSTRGML